MTLLRHAIKITKPRADVFRALTGRSEMAAWHVGSVEGAIATGQTLVLVPKPGLR